MPNHAQHEIIEKIYAQLRGIAAARLAAERRDHTLQPTALANEVVVRLLAQDVAWENEAQILCVAVQIARRLLIDHARRKKSLKRGGVRRRVELEQADVAAQSLEVDYEEVDRALTKLAKIDERQAEVAALKHVLGLRIDQIAAALGVSSRTVDNEWVCARAWLERELRGASSAKPKQR